MQPINNNQKYAAEYSALETALAVCNDETLKSVLSSKFQELAKQMGNQPQQASFTASPAITASAPKVSATAAAIGVTGSGSVSSTGKESDSKLNKDDYYGTFKWFSQVMNEDMEFEAKVLMGATFVDEHDEAMYLLDDHEFVSGVVKDRILPETAIFVHSVLGNIGEEFEKGNTSINLKLVNNKMDLMGFKQINLAKWLKTINIDVAERPEGFSFYWARANEYLTWWTQGGEKTLKQYILSNLPKSSSTAEKASTANAAASAAKK